jgi:hypothetical protein
VQTLQQKLFLPEQQLSVLPARAQVQIQQPVRPAV